MAMGGQIRTREERSPVQPVQTMRRPEPLRFGREQTSGQTTGQGQVGGLLPARIVQLPDSGATPNPIPGLRFERGTRDAAFIAPEEMENIMLNLFSQFI